MHDPAPKLPLDYFLAQPVVGKRAVTMSLEFSDEKFSVVFHGQTYAYRGRMDGAGITGGYVGEGAARKYYRIMKDLHCVDDKDKFMNILGSEVFKHLAIRCFVEEPPSKDSQGEALLEELKSMPQLFF